MQEFNLLNYVIPGIKIFSVIHNCNKKIKRIEPDSDFPIVIGEKEKGNKEFRFNRYGSVLKEGRECLLFPDNDTTTWEGYITPKVYKQGEIVQAITPECLRLVAVYSHFDTEKGLHYCFHSIAGNGAPELAAYLQVDKIHKQSGYLYCKAIYANQYIGKMTGQTKEHKDEL
jgi:hypothetical protein